jgi:hypothetical protein
VRTKQSGLAATKAGAEAIKRVFDAEFGSHALYGMVLPDDAVERRSGAFEQNGWEVQYKLGIEDGVEYLDFFTSHRMTNDRLYRAYADGRLELIAASTDGAMKDVDVAFYEDLERRGFDAKL